MQTTDPTTNDHNRHIKAYRNRLQNQGVKRVEVRIPAQDVPLMHDIADILRTGGIEARTLREQVHHATGDDQYASGKDLIAFFQTSPLKDAELNLERDVRTSRTIAL